MLTRGSEPASNVDQLAANQAEAPIEGDQPERRLRPFIGVLVVMALVQAALMVYALARAFSWDEGFHLLAAQLIKRGTQVVRTAAWYAKEQPTFSDAIAVVRRYLWSQCHFSTSTANDDVIKISRSLFDRLTDAVCYAA